MIQRKVARSFEALQQHRSRASMIVVSGSGGKDSDLAAFWAAEEFGADRVIMNHQYLPEDHPETVGHCQQICDLLGIRLFVCHGNYYAMRCRQCETRHIAMHPEQAWCRACGAHESDTLHQIQGVNDLIEHRGLFPDLGNRYCMSYMKRDAFNTWAREQRELLGAYPVVVMGERWAESPTRAALPVLRDRTHLPQEWMVEYRPILAYHRCEVFRELRDLGLPLHPCYDRLWRMMLIIEHEDWRNGDPMLDRPRNSYEGQWEGLREVEVLPEEVLAGMLYVLKYECPEEQGGPRCSCANCWLFGSLFHRAALRIESSRPQVLRSLAIEQQIGHRMTKNASLAEMLLPPYVRRQMHS